MGEKVQKLNELVLLFYLGELVLIYLGTILQNFVAQTILDDHFILQWESREALWHLEQAFVALEFYLENDR